MVSFDGGSVGKVDDVTACRIQDGGYALLWQRYDNNKMAGICYYGNVMATTRWRLYITMETLSQHWDNVSSVTHAGRLHADRTIQNTSVRRQCVLRLCGSVMEEHNNTDLSDKRKPNSYEQQTIFYIFNSTVIDWPCYIFFIILNLFPLIIYQQAVYC